jgi:hypothetical protein
MDYKFLNRAFKSREQKIETGSGFLKVDFFLNGVEEPVEKTVPYYWEETPDGIEVEAVLPALTNANDPRCDFQETFYSAVMPPAQVLRFKYAIL